MNVIYDLQKSLETLQDNVIGVFRNYKLKDYELVVSIESTNMDHWVKCVSISKLGALHITHISSKQGKLILFEENETLSDIKNNPYRLQEILEEISK